MLRCPFNSLGKVAYATLSFIFIELAIWGGILGVGGYVAATDVESGVQADKS